ncbi:MAG: NRDE family protein [Planctomycetota bacterium]
MCTLTWTRHRGEAIGPDGYRLWFNRDELRARGREVPPHVKQTAGGLRYIAPADSDAGGTWIAANELGITVALLNGYRSSRGEPRDGWTSRGHLVRELAGIRSLTDAWRRLTPERLQPFRPLVLAVLTPARPALIARWDGQDVTLDPRGQRQLPVTSSSYAAGPCSPRWSEPTPEAGSPWTPASSRPSSAGPLREARTPSVPPCPGPRLPLGASAGWK